MQQTTKGGYSENTLGISVMIVWQSSSGLKSNNSLSAGKAEMHKEPSERTVTQYELCTTALGDFKHFAVLGREGSCTSQGLPGPALQSR